jgi:hypothetical protein
MFFIKTIDPDFRAFVDRRTVAPSNAGSMALQSLFKGLKAPGLWNEIDGLWIGLSNRNDAALNLKGTSYSLREISGAEIITSITNGATHLYETYTPSGTTQVTANNTAGNGSFYTNSLGSVNANQVYTFSYDLTVTSGQTPSWQLRSGSGGYNSGSSLGGNAVLATGTGKSISFSPTATSANCYLVIYNTGASTYTISNMSLVQLTTTPTSGFTGSTSGRYTWGTNFIPSAEASSRYVASGYSSMGVWMGQTVAANSNYDMGTDGTASKIMPRAAGGNLQGFMNSSNLANPVAPTTSLKGLYSVKRYNTGITGASVYQRGVLIGTSATSAATNPNTNGQEIYLSNTNNGTASLNNSSGRAIQIAFIGGDVNIERLDYVLNQYLKNIQSGSYDY